MPRKAARLGFLLFVTLLIIIAGCGYTLDITPGDGCASGSWHALRDGSEVCGDKHDACRAECDVGRQMCAESATDQDATALETCRKARTSCEETCTGREEGAGTRDPRNAGGAQ